MAMVVGRCYYRLGASASPYASSETETGIQNSLKVSTVIIRIFFTAVIQCFVVKLLPSVCVLFLVVFFLSFCFLLVLPPFMPFGCVIYNRGKIKLLPFYCHFSVILSYSRSHRWAFLIQPPHLSLLCLASGFHSLPTNKKQQSQL